MDEELDPEERENLIEHQMLIGSAIDFIRSITAIYGPEKGMELWGTIAETIDPNIKLTIFKELIGGAGGTKLIIKSAGVADKITLIKEIRHWTGFGLKEAKDLSDQLYVNPVRPVVLQIPNVVHMAEARKAFRAIGCTINN